MKQRRVGEDAVEALPGQIELEEILLQDLTAAVRTRRGRELRRAIVGALLPENASALE